MRAGDRQRRDRWLGGRVRLVELNVQIPVMALGVLESMRLLANACEVLATKTIDGITANVDRARFLAEASPSIVTPLNRLIGYENAAKIAKPLREGGLTVREATIELGFVERGEISLEQLGRAARCDHHGGR